MTADESTACDECKHQPYDHGDVGCRVIRSSGVRCECRRRRVVLERANEIVAELPRRAPGGDQGGGER